MDLTYILLKIHDCRENKLTKCCATALLAGSVQCCCFVLVFTSSSDVVDPAESVKVSLGNSSRLPYMKTIKESCIVIKVHLN